MARNAVNAPTRPSWDRYFLDLAQTVSTRATCPRASVGCVLVRARTVLVSGYNGSVTGEEHCYDVGCALEHGHCRRTIHAELNALLQAARVGASVAGSTAYCTHSPCLECYRALVQAGVVSVVYEKAYGVLPVGPVALLGSAISVE